MQTYIPPLISFPGTRATSWPSLARKGCAPSATPTPHLSSAWGDTPRVARRSNWLDSHSSSRAPPPRRPPALWKVMISLPLRNTEHPLPTTAASPQRLTPTRRHHYNKNKGRARRRTPPQRMWPIIGPPKLAPEGRGSFDSEYRGGGPCVFFAREW